ncbi:MAG TPA: Bax inhibitor-1/YccA family protein [Ktedonobacteraceae bacterium]|jgi:modulator of FtsH protease|nr:Bax inhibitor-1/YccA family protein [Ktedonobacteraceae bacterium]
MYNMRNDGPSGSRSAYQYQTLPYGYEGGIQASGLISKVMGLLALCFVVAAIGTFVGFYVLTPTSYIVVMILGFVVLLALRFLIQKQGLNLFLLYLFAFIEGMGLGPLLGYYLQSAPNILGEAFILTALTAFGLAIYSWTTKRDFSRIGDYLFGGLILLIVASLVGLFFHSALFQLVICVVGVAVFSGFVLYYVQRARYMADTMPNAIGLTVSLFITLINLFLYILEILSIVQGGGGRRR